MAESTSTSLILAKGQLDRIWTGTTVKTKNATDVVQYTEGQLCIGLDNTKSQAMLFIDDVDNENNGLLKRYTLGTDWSFISNIPDASKTSSGIVNTSTFIQYFSGPKTFCDSVVIGEDTTSNNATLTVYKQIIAGNKKSNTLEDTETILRVFGAITIENNANNNRVQLVYNDDTKSLDFIFS